MHVWRLCVLWLCVVAMLGLCVVWGLGLGVWMRLRGGRGLPGVERCGSMRVDCED